MLKQSFGIGFSITASLPYYVFFVDKKNLTYNKKDLVVFKYPGEDIYNYKKDESFVKIISCIPGDILKTTESYQYFCNGENIGSALLKDGLGKKLTPFVFNGIVPENKYFVTGTHFKSWDSRYWGFITKDRIIANAKGLI